jgi:hypothetical protein
MLKMAKMERCDEAHPNRCQATFAGGQCPYISAIMRQDGENIIYAQYCVMHGASGSITADKKRRQHDYLLQQWSERVDNFSESNNVKNLRGEIGILRLSLEHVLAQVKTPQQFPVFADKIQGLVRDIKSVVEVCQKIEERNKELLSKTEVMNIADTVIQTVAEFIDDSDKLQAIGEALYVSITGAICGTNSLGHQ